MTHPEQKTIAEENNDFVLVRIRVPRYIYRSLCIMSAKRDLKFTRFVIELLRTVVHKDYAGTKKEAKEPELVWSEEKNDWVWQ